MPRYKLTQSDKEAILDLFHSSRLTQVQVGALFDIAPSRVSSLWKATFSAEERRSRKTFNYVQSKLGALNPSYGLKGDKSPSFKGVINDCRGYLMVLRPSWYTGRRNSKHVFEHSVIVCERMGLSEIPRGWHVHHCDKNPHNNAFDNLVLMTSGDHTRLHQFMRSEGVTTMSKDSTLKWVEANGTLWGHDIV